MGTLASLHCYLPSPLQGQARSSLRDVEKPMLVEIMLTFVNVQKWLYHDTEYA